MVPGTVLNVTKERGQCVSVNIRFKENIFRAIVGSASWDVKTNIARHARLGKAFSTRFHSLSSRS